MNNKKKLVQNNKKYEPAFEFYFYGLSTGLDIPVEVEASGT